MPLLPSCDVVGAGVEWHNCLVADMLKISFGCIFVMVFENRVPLMTSAEMPILFCSVLGGNKQKVYINRIKFRLTLY